MVWERQRPIPRPSWSLGYTAGAVTLMPLPNHPSSEADGFAEQNLLASSKTVLPMHIALVVEERLVII